MIHIPPHRPLADIRILRIFRVKTINNQSSVINNHLPCPSVSSADIYFFLLIAVQFLIIAVHQPRPLADIRFIRVVRVKTINYLSSLIETCFLTSSACGPISFNSRLIRFNLRSPPSSACGHPYPSAFSV